MRSKSQEASFFPQSIRPEQSEIKLTCIVTEGKRLAQGYELQIIYISCDVVISEQMFGLFQKKLAKHKSQRM